MKKYMCLLLAFALALSSSTVTFAAEEGSNDGQEIVIEVEDSAPTEENEPPRDNTDNSVEMENDEENIATPIDLGINFEQRGEDLDEPEENPLLLDTPPENVDDGGTEKSNVVTVSWEIENATIDISLSSYIWNTETLQYEEQSTENAMFGSKQTVNVSITISNQFGCTIDYDIAYNPDNSMIESSETQLGESASSGRIEKGELLTYTGVVTVTDIINSEQIADEGNVTLGTYYVTIGSVEFSW